MKARKNKSSLLLLVLFVIFLASPVYAGENQLSIHLGKIENMATLKDLSFSVYQIGIVENGKPVIYDQYEVSEYPQKAYLLGATAKNLAEVVKWTPSDSKETNEYGMLTFNNLNDGVYLVKQEGKNTYGEVDPFLVYLPYYENVGGLMTGPNRFVTVEPKVSPFDTPAVTVPSATPSGGTTDRVGTPIKTGDTTNIMLYVSLMGLSLISFSLLYRKIRESST